MYRKGGGGGGTYPRRSPVKSESPVTLSHSESLRVTRLRPLPVSESCRPPRPRPALMKPCGVLQSGQRGQEPTRTSHRHPCQLQRGPAYKQRRLSRQSRRAGPARPPRRGGRLTVGRARRRGSGAGRGCARTRRGTSTWGRCAEGAAADSDRWLGYATRIGDSDRLGSVTRISEDTDWEF